MNEVGTGSGDDATVPAPAGANERGFVVDRIWTVPNLLTLIRLCCIPVFLWLLFGADRPGPAGILLAVVCATDWVDGYVARHFGQESTFGKMFDPTVDRAVLVFGVGGILLYGAVPAWLGWTIVSREALLSVFVIVITALGARRMDVTWYGKAGTFAIMFGLPSFLGAAEGSWSSQVRRGFEIHAWLWIVPGLVLSFIAFYQYIPGGIRALREGRGVETPTRSG